MKLNFATQLNFDEFKNVKFDYVFFSSGYENRSSHLLRLLDFSSELFKNSKRFCFSFDNNIILDREYNDKLFADNEFVFIKGNTIYGYIKEIKNIFETNINDDVNILVDISSMSKIMYAAIIKYFNITEDLKNANVYFLYSISKYYLKDAKNTKINHNEPIPINNNISITDQKISLFIDLGYEKGIAEGIIEYMQLNQEDVTLFYTSLLNDSDFFKCVQENNKHLIKRISDDAKFEYNVTNPTQLIGTLDSLFANFKSNRIIITPLGNKLFTLCSFLFAVKYDNITVFRISEGDQGVKINKYAKDDIDPVILMVNFNKSNA